MPAQPLILPAQAAHLRIHKSLELHLFDADNNLIGIVPLRDRLLTVHYRSQADGAPIYLVDEDRDDPSQSFHLHLPMELPTQQSEYFDDYDSQPTMKTSEWFFRVGFQKDPEDLRIGILTGIGTVDIADISILPDPISIARQSGSGCRLWRCIFPPKPIPSTKELIGIPTNFPDSTSLRMAIKIRFDICADKVVEGAHHIRLGAFMGRMSETSPDLPYIFVCGNPALFGLEATHLGIEKP